MEWGCEVIGCYFLVFGYDGVMLFLGLCGFPQTCLMKG